MHTTRDCAVSSALLVAAVLATWRCTPVAAATTTRFSTSFSSQSTGALVTGMGPNRFSGTRGASRLSVENTTVFSPPNALAVTIVGGGSAYAYKRYRNSYTQYTLTFSLHLGAAFTVPHNAALVVAQTVPSTTSKVGKVNVTIPADNRIRLDYFDREGRQHYLWGHGRALPRGSWHRVELRETIGAGSSRLTLLVDGTTVASRDKLALGRRGVTWFAVGEEYAPPGRGYAGRLYIDDVIAQATP
jgi:hypothetical protein